jgi:hypothetical protein
LGHYGIDNVNAGLCAAEYPDVRWLFIAAIDIMKCNRDISPSS